MYVQWRVHIKNKSDYVGGGGGVRTRSGHPMLVAVQIKYAVMEMY